MVTGRYDTVGRLDPSGGTDGSTAGRGRDQEGGRTRLPRGLQRWLIPTAIGAALVLLLIAGMVAGRARPASPVLPAADRAAAADAGAARASLPGQAGASAGRERDAARAAQAAAGIGVLEFFPGEEVAGATRPARDAAGQGLLEVLPGELPARSLPVAPAGTGSGPLEHLPGEQDARPLPSLAPQREPAPDFGPQP